MSPAMVMNEEEAMELLAFLVTAARIQVDEPPDYAPMRLQPRTLALCHEPPQSPEIRPRHTPGHLLQKTISGW